MNQSVTWSGHTFTVCDMTANWNDVPGIYIFTAVSNGKWCPVYIGQTDSFATRLPNHDRWDHAQRSGATHVHAMVVNIAADRDAIEQGLIRVFQPPLNNHHR